MICKLFSLSLSLSPALHISFFRLFAMVEELDVHVRQPQNPVLLFHQVADTVELIRTKF